MASYHLSLKTHSRSPESALTGPAAAAYRSGTRIACERDGRIHDFTPRAHGVEAAFITAPDGVTWAQDRELLWNRAEAAERRKDAQFAHEIEIAIAHEIDRPADREALVRMFANEVVRRHGVVADVAIHRPHRHGDARNYHGHILFTTRRADETGFAAKKDRELSEKKTNGAALEAFRELWGTLENAFLERAGSDVRVDHRSYERRGEALVPMRHLGKSASALEREEGNKERKAGVARPMPTGPGASLPPAGVAKAGSAPVTEAGRYNAAAQAENASMREAKTAREAEIAAMQAEMARLATELRVEEAREARIEQIAAAARMDRARARLGIAKRGGPGLPTHLRRFGLDAAAALGIDLDGAATPVTPDLGEATAPLSQPGATARRSSTDPRSVRPRAAQLRRAETAARDAERAAALKTSIKAVVSAWGKGPLAEGGRSAAMYWQEPRWHVTFGSKASRSEAEKTQRLAHEIGLSDKPASFHAGHRAAYASFTELGQYRESLPAADRTRFDTELANASRRSSRVYLGMWTLETFNGQLVTSLSENDLVLENMMATSLGLEGFLSRRNKAASQSPAVPVRPDHQKSVNQPSAASTPIQVTGPQILRTAASPAQPQRPAGWAARVELVERIRAASPPTPPVNDQVAAAAPETSEMRAAPPHAAVRSTERDRTPDRGQPIGTRAARAMLDDDAVIHVDALGDVVMIVRAEKWNGIPPRQPGDAPGQNGLGPDSAGIGLTWKRTRIAPAGWLDLRATLDDLAEAFGRLPMAEALRWTARLARATIETMGNRRRRQDSPDPSQQSDGAPGQPAASLGHNGPPPPRPYTSNYAAKLRPGDKPIGAAAADALLRDAGIVHVNAAGKAEVILTTKRFGANNRHGNDRDPWNAVWPLYPDSKRIAYESIGRAQWSRTWIDLVEAATTIGAKTRQVAEWWIDDLVRANAEGNASRDHARAEEKKQDEAVRAGEAARAEARAARLAEIKAAGEAAASEARARREAAAANPDLARQPTRKKPTGMRPLPRPGQMKRPRGRGKGGGKGGGPGL